MSTSATQLDPVSTPAEFHGWTDREEYFSHAPRTPVISAADLPQHLTGAQEAAGETWWNMLTTGERDAARELTRQQAPWLRPGEPVTPADAYRWHIRTPDADLQMLELLRQRIAGTKLAAAKAPVDGPAAEVSEPRSWAIGDEVVTHRGHRGRIIRMDSHVATIKAGRKLVSDALDELSPPPPARRAQVFNNAHRGSLRQTVLVVGETPKYYRIRSAFNQRLLIPGRATPIKAGAEGLVPKGLVTFEVRS